MKLVRRITSAVMSFMVAASAAIPNIQTVSAADYTMNSGKTVVENLSANKLRKTVPHKKIATIY